MFLQDKTKNDTMIQEQLDVIEWMIKLDKMGKNGTDMFRDY